MLVYDNGVENSAARFNLAVVNVDLIYFVNYLENRVYRLIGTSITDYVTDNTPYDTTEPFDRLSYPLRAPSSITYTSPTSSDSLIFADTDNDRIMRLSFADLTIYYLVANAGAPAFPKGSTRWRWRRRSQGWSTTTRSRGRYFSWSRGATAYSISTQRGRCVCSPAPGDGIFRRRGPRDGRRVERPAGGRGRLPRQRLHRRQRQPRGPDGRRRRVAVTRVTLRENTELGGPAESTRRGVPHSRTNYTPWGTPTVGRTAGRVRPASRVPFPQSPCIGKVQRSRRRRGRSEVKRSRTGSPHGEPRTESPLRGGVAGLETRDLREWSPEGRCAAVQVHRKASHERSPALRGDPAKGSPPAE